METVYQQIDELVAAGVIDEAEAARRRIAVRGDMSSSLEASYLASVHETVRNAAIAPPEARAEMIADVDRQIDELVAVGAIDAAEAEKRRIALRGDISRARAADLLENDPEGFLTEDLEGGFEGMDGNTLATYRAMAEAGLKARHKEFITEQKRVQKQREVEVKAELNDMRDIMLAGQPVAEIARLDDPEYQAHPQYAETMAAYSLFVERENIFAMTTDELDDLIQQEKSRKLKHKYQLERLELLDKVRADHQRGYGADPIAYQRQINPKSITDLPDFTTDTAPDFAAALRARRVDAEQLVEQGHVKADVVRLFDDEELARLQRQMAVDKDPEDRLALAAVLANELGEGGTADRLTAVVDDPVLAHVAAMAWRGGSKATALETLRGQQMIEANNVTLPPAAERLGATYGLIEDLFADVPAGEASLAAAIGAADALYARRTGRTEVGGEIDERAYKQALHAVMGGTGEFNSGDATGGVQEVRGQMTMLPVGIRASAVESALEMLGHEELPRDERAARGRGASLAYNPDLAAEHWRAASGGQVPQINGEPIAPETLDSLYLMAVGEDRFVALADTRSGKRVVYNESGAPFVFSLRRLIRETGGGQ
ncbi:hypothetical protein CDO87_03400 [Sagittula sp. P11]|nr:hypothetical protein CDO87_03400 [Sagittula sp. P11]